VSCFSSTVRSSPALATGREFFDAVAVLLDEPPPLHADRLTHKKVSHKRVDVAFIVLILFLASNSCNEAENRPDL